MNTNAGAGECHILQADDCAVAVVAAGAAVTFTGCRRYQGLLSEPGQVLPPHLVTAGWTLA